MRRLLACWIISALAMLSPMTAMAEDITITDPTGVSGAFGLETGLVSGLQVDDAGGAWNYVYQVCWGRRVFFTAPPDPPSTSALPVMQANQVRVNATMEYDCTSFGANGLCVSIGTRASETDAADSLLLATHAVLAYRVSDAFRFGGYLDVGTGGLPEGLEYDGPAPVIGAFIGFGRGLGWNGKATVALGFGDVVAEDADEETADSVSSIGIDGWAGYAFALDQNWIVMPVLGLRKSATSFNDGEESLEEASANFTLRISGLVAERVRASFSFGADVTLQLEPEVEEYTATRLFAAGEVSWELAEGLEMSIGGSVRQLAAGDIGYDTTTSLTFAY